jgi:hypothetical protein
MSQHGITLYSCLWQLSRLSLVSPAPSNSITVVSDVVSDVIWYEPYMYHTVTGVDVCVRWLTPAHGI